MSTAYVILAVADRPIPRYEQIVDPNVRTVHSERERIREYIRAAPLRPLRLSMSAAMFKRFRDMEGTPGLMIERDE